MATTFISLNDLTLHYRLDGWRAGVPLVFINALGSDLRVWDAVVARFCERFPILRYDKRGHGLSDCPPGPYTIGHHASDLAGLLERLDIGKAILVGISVGGLIALDLAAHRPERVRALVLSDTAAKIGTPEFWQTRIEEVRGRGLPTVARAILRRWFAESFVTTRPAEYRGYYNMLSRTPEAGYVATCEAIRDADLRRSLKSIRVPALVLCGAEDGATPPGLGLELSQALPQARFEEIDGAGHLPCIERPEEMAAKIARFLEENGYA